MDTPFRTPIRPASAAARTPFRTTSLQQHDHSASQVYTTTPARSSYSTPSSSPSTVSPATQSSTSNILIPTPKLGRFLRPLRAKLAHFRQAASSAPQAHRELLEPPTPSHRPHPPRRAAPSTTSSQATPQEPTIQEPPVTYALRKSAQSRPASAPPPDAHRDAASVSQLLSTVTHALAGPTAVGRTQAPLPSTRVPTPLRPSIASIQDAYRDVVLKTWRRPPASASTVCQPLPLVDLAAFALGELIADQCEDQEDAVDELEGVYADLPVHFRSRVFLQHATRLCIASAHEPSILVGLAGIASTAATRVQFLSLARAAVARDPTTVTLDALTSLTLLAVKSACVQPLVDALVRALRVEHMQRTTYVQFARWALGRAELAAATTAPQAGLWVAGAVAAKMLALILSTPGDAALALAVEYTKVMLGVVAKVVDCGAHVPYVCMDQVEALTRALAARQPRDTGLTVAVTYPLAAALLVYATGDPKLTLLLRQALPAAPQPGSSDSDTDCPRAAAAHSPSLILLYQTTPPTFWLEVAHALHAEARAPAHALAVVRDLLDDVQDGEMRCGLTANELARWAELIAHEMQDVDDGEPSGTSGARGRTPAKPPPPPVVESAVSDEPRVEMQASVPPVTPIRLPPPPILTPSGARESAHFPMAWHELPVHQNRFQEPAPRDSDDPARYRSKRTQAAASENDPLLSTRPLRACRKRSRTGDPLPKMPGVATPSARKSARRSRSQTAPVGNDPDGEGRRQVSLPPPPLDGAPVRMAGDVEIVDPLSETEEADDWLMTGM